MLAAIGAAGGIAPGTAAAQIASSPRPEPSVETPASAVRPISYRLIVTPDPASMRFEGEIHLHFEVLQPIRQIALDSSNLEIRSARIEGVGELAFRLDAPTQRVLFDSGRVLNPGAHDMVVRYAGRIIDGLGGFFRPNERKDLPPDAVPIYASSCCVAMARRIAPLWDEPDQKAVFQLELIVDERADAVSNMPIESRRPAPGGRSRIVFQATPKMSTHQLFFTVGSYERQSTNAGNVEIGVLLPRGTARNGTFALAATREILEHLNQRLALPYPLPKLDSVGLPVPSAGAIEYWGSILYSERYLAVGEAWSTAEELQAGYKHVAHELSHQWFGNLVTSRDWRHNWLNEAFAEWLSIEVTDHFHPEWDVWLKQAPAREAVMQLDARSTSHPVLLRSVNIEDQGAVFDSFTYVKGSQIVRMLAELAGPDRFQAALRDYLRQFAYGNASSDDLWRALSAQLPAEVEQVGRDFIEQEGVPLIDVLSTRCKAGDTTISLRQDRHGLDEASRSPRRWRVPVTAMTLEAREVRSRIISGPEPVQLIVPGCGAVKVNLGGTGYFRTRYDGKSLQALQAELSRLSPADRRNLSDDQSALESAQDVATDGARP